MQYNSNINVVVGGLANKLTLLAEQPDELLRTVALAVLPELKRRVHIEGRASDGNAIGTYSPGYMKQRTGDYGNSGRISRGANKGKLKDAGTATKGASIGKARPKFNRTADTTVILSLTRQMENDLSVLSSGNGYGIGFNNRHNYDKSQWNEKTYRKKIWSLTQGEQTLAKQTAESYVEGLLN